MSFLQNTVVYSNDIKLERSAEPRNIVVIGRGREMTLTWKKKNKKKKRPLEAISVFQDLPDHQNLPEANTTQPQKKEDEEKLGALDQHKSQLPASATKLADSFQAQGNKLAEDGKYREALGKWEAALTLMPESAVIHEQKALLLEIGDAWSALKAATRATELEPSWAEAWTTLGRAQLNFGEPDSAIQSFDRALAIKPDSAEAQDDRRSAFHLVKKRKQLQVSGLNTSSNRYVDGDKSESP